MKYSNSKRGGVFIHPILKKKKWEALLINSKQDNFLFRKGLRDKFGLFSKDVPFPYFCRP